MVFRYYSKISKDGYSKESKESKLGYGRIAYIQKRNQLVSNVDQEIRNLF